MSPSAPAPAIAETTTAAIPGHVVSPCQSAFRRPSARRSATANAIAPVATAAHSARARNASTELALADPGRASAVSQTAEMYAVVATATATDRDGRRVQPAREQVARALPGGTRPEAMPPTAAPSANGDDDRREREQALDRALRPRRVRLAAQHVADRAQHDAEPRRSCSGAASVEAIAAKADG